MEPTLWWGHGFGFMWLIPLVIFVIFIIFVRGIFGLNSSGCGSHDGSTKHPYSAREILDKRFAKGEITKDDYEEMKKTLEN